MSSAFPTHEWTPCHRLPTRIALCHLAVSLFVANQSSATDSNPNPPKPKLWAGISIPQPVYVQRGGATKRVHISFSVVNDGKQPVRPQLSESKLIINGEELKEWEFIVMNGLSDDRYDLLPAGDYLHFLRDLSRYVNTPGIYRVTWKGPDFQSNELVFRVLPDKRAK